MQRLSPALRAVVEEARQPPIPKEPARDWSFGIVTGHRCRVVAYFIIGLAVLYAFQHLIRSPGRPPSTLIEHIWTWASLLWLGPLIPSTLDLIGLMRFRHPERLDEAKPINKLVAWRIVSRGDNVQALLATIRCCQQEMARTPLFPYVIEVVTDVVSPVVPAPNDDVRLIAVPRDYRTPNGSRFKARALHYALTHSDLPSEAWIVHLDEETHPTSSGIKGICAMIAEEERSGRLRIGQGAILYHRMWGRYPFLTLADNVRTGVDFGHFYFQHELGVTVFGLHGSYIVVRNDVEKATGGFDFGPHGDITEDAFWALVAMEQGYRCRWVEGYLEEQSTQSVGDFLRQRRRWSQGLVNVALHAPVKLRWRLWLGINIALWALAPFAICYTILRVFYGFQIAPWIQFLANYCYAAFVVAYLVGLKANLDEHGITDRWKRRRWFFLQVALLPIFSTMESIGTCWGLLRPGRGFHVVKK